MGTSKSHGGPRGRSPLLPSWAQDGGDGPPPPGADGAGPPPDADGAPDGPPQPADGQQVPIQPRVPPMGNFGPAKRAMSRVAAGTGGGGGGGGFRGAAS